MRDVNRRYLRCDAPTDVLSFRYPPLPGEAEEAGGELFVNVQRALERAPRAPSRELALYLAHACDHLAGHDDADDAARRRMRRRELRWLRELGAACEGLLRH
ncbi:MAG: rRNA maturation RNase YbeY [Lentisphaerae bacterium]|nr:rRNA maturation RNase YbeY [Lentisphaerota bacterium]